MIISQGGQIINTEGQGIPTSMMKEPFGNNQNPAIPATHRQLTRAQSKDQYLNSPARD